MNEILEQLQELQAKRFEEEWKELGRLIIIEELQNQLLWLIRYDISIKSNVFNFSTSFVDLLPKSC